MYVSVCVCVCVLLLDRDNFDVRVSRHTDRFKASPEDAVDWEHIFIKYTKPRFARVCQRWPILDAVCPGWYGVTVAVGCTGRSARYSSGDPEGGHSIVKEIGTLLHRCPTEREHGAPALGSDFFCFILLPQSPPDLPAHLTPVDEMCRVVRDTSSATHTLSPTQTPLFLSLGHLQ